MMFIEQPLDLPGSAKALCLIKHVNCSQCIVYVRVESYIDRQKAMESFEDLWLNWYFCAFFFKDFFIFVLLSAHLRDLVSPVCGIFALY